MTLVSHTARCALAHRAWSVCVSPDAQMCHERCKKAWKYMKTLDVAQLCIKNATFLKLFSQKSCTKEIFALPLHPLLRTNYSDKLSEQNETCFGYAAVRNCIKRKLSESNLSSC